MLLWSVSKRWPLLVTLVLCCSLAVTVNPAGAAGDDNPDALTLVLQWHHQSQFAGYYMALEKGLYKDAGLEVTILRGGSDVRPDRLLAEGRADFISAMLPTALEMRRDGLPLVLLAQLVNRGNFQLVAWKHPDGSDGTPVVQPADLSGRRVTVWEQDFRSPYLALFRGWGARPEILPQYYSLSLFLHRGVVACSTMRYNEYHTLLQNGVSADELTVFNLWELGINLPEDGLYALADTWRRRPEASRRFVRATLEGWRYARDHRQETLEVVMRYIEQEKLPTNRPHMAWMLDEILKSIFPTNDDPWTFGVLSRQSYRETTQLLQRQGRIDSPPAYQDFVRTEALNGPL